MSASSETAPADQPSELDEPALGRQARDRNLEFLERFGLLLLTGVAVLFFAVWGKTSGTYLDAGNIQTTIGNQVVLAITAIALIPPLVCNRYDLSIGGIVGITAVACAAVMSKHDWPLAAAVVLAVTLGAGVGLVNGLLITRLRIDSLIATLATATLLGGIISWYTKGLGIVSNLSADLLAFGSTNTLGFPTILIVAAAVAVGVWYLMQHTPFGRYLQSVGANEEAARLVGANVDRLVVLAFAAAGAVAGIAGVVLVARTGGISPNAGPAYLLPAFAAAFLGAAAMRPGRFNVWGTVVAIGFLAAITSGLNLAGAQDYVSSLVNGLALLIGVGFTAQFARRRAGQ